MAESPELTAIIAYLEANRSTYTEQVLRQQLLRDGATPELVEQAIARVYGAALPPPSFAASGVALPADDAALETALAFVQANPHLPALQLKEQLTQAGVDPETSDLAIAKIRGFRETGAAQLKPTSSNRKLTYSIGIPLTIINAILIFFSVEAIDFLRLAIWAVLLSQLVASAYLFFSKKNRPVAKGLFLGCIGPFLLGSIAFALFFGYCLLVGF